MSRCLIIFFSSCLMLLSFCSFSGSSKKPSLSLDIEGVGGEVARNVKARLFMINTEDTTDNHRLRSRVKAEITLALEALGYYHSAINFEFTPKSVLLAKITLGEPVLIAGIDVMLTGHAKNDPDYQALLKETPTIGSILNQGKFDEFVDALNGLAVSKGYFDAKMNETQLRIALDLNKAFWKIHFDSGERYRFGKVTFHGSQIKDPYLQNLVPFHIGDNYSADNTAELNRRLSATNWFSAALVSPDFGSLKTSQILPLDAVLTPRTKNNVELGGGYSTSIGPRLKASWNKPWVNSQGHSLTTKSNLSAAEQNLAFSYRIPLIKNALEEYYLLQAGLKTSRLNDTKSNTSTMNVARFWNFSNGWQPAIHFRWSLEKFTQGKVDSITGLLYPGISMSKTRQSGEAMPYWGDSQRYSLDISNKKWASDINFEIIQAQNVWIRTLGKKNRFIVKTHLGWIATKDFQRMPPSLRFFAGGDGSIRGYKLKSISPRDSDHKLTGATKLLTASVEYQYNVMGRWWGAAFVDSGEAVNDIRQSDFKTGAGIGIRWASPVGPIKFDIATPIGDKENKKIQFYIGLGPEI
ncbi:autotransporter assembly complex protein TamA [Candidatus Williamhamiltonella defendens]|uniref:autotransporter assembly complex protein TamA n=1 Tax=Candidatus Williamhamiltonella defendens TaxID=138072 RepID=UPI0015838FC6|nr:autotransporter assembly complex family protein [Candidatus Hamiltonella defensa]